MKTIKDPETGEETEVYEKEEFEQEVAQKLEEEKTKIQEELEVKEKEWEDKEQDFQSQLSEKEKELDELKDTYSYDDKDKNFAKLRDQIKAKEKEVKEIKNNFQKEISGLRTSMEKKEVDSIVSIMAGSDNELKDKILHHYGRIKDTADTRDQIMEKMKDAYVLATGGIGDPLAQTMGTAGSASVKKDETLPEDVKEIGRQFGLTDEDFQKASKK